MKNRLGLYLTGTNTLMEGCTTHPQSKGSVCTTEFRLQLPLLYIGNYSFSQPALVVVCLLMPFCGGDSVGTARVNIAEFEAPATASCPAPPVETPNQVRRAFGTQIAGVHVHSNPRQCHLQA